MLCSIHHQIVPKLGLNNQWPVTHFLTCNWKKLASLKKSNQCQYWPLKCTITKDYRKTYKICKQTNISHQCLNIVFQVLSISDLLPPSLWRSLRKEGSGVRHIRNWVCAALTRERGLERGARCTLVWIFCHLYFLQDPYSPFCQSQEWLNENWKVCSFIKKFKKWIQGKYTTYD